MALPPQTQTWEEPSAPDSQGHAPHQMTGLFVQLLRWLFGSSDNILIPPLRDYIWKEDPAESKILIEHVWNWHPEKLEQRPALFVRRGAHRQIRTSIGDGGHHAELNVVSGGVAYERLWVGTAIVFAIGNQPAEAEAIGLESSRFLNQFGPQIRADFKLMRFSQLDHGEIGKLEEADEHYVVPSTYAFAYWEFWEIVQEAPPLMKFRIQPAF